jgi:hypothetical protein
MKIVAMIVGSALTMITAGVVAAILLVSTLVAVARPASATTNRYDVHTTGWQPVSYLGPWGGNWNTERQITSWRVMQTGWAVPHVYLYDEVCARLHYSAGPVNVYKSLGCSTTSQRIQ